MPTIDNFIDKDLDKVLSIEQDINLLKIKYNFIKNTLYVSDTGLVGLLIYSPRLVHILHYTVLKDYINGFKWEGEFLNFKNDLKMIDNILNKYSNIEFILPIRPNYGMIKYLDEEFAKYKDLYNYSHEDYSYRNKTYIERIQYYLIVLYNKFIVCCKNEYYFQTI